MVGAVVFILSFFVKPGVGVRVGGVFNYSPLSDRVLWYCCVHYREKGTAKKHSDESSCLFSLCKHSHYTCVVALSVRLQGPHVDAI